MKKLSVIVLSMLLVLSIGQAAFANNYVGLLVGMSFPEGAPNPSFVVGAKALYDISDRFSINAKAIGEKDFKDPASSFNLKAQADLRFKIVDIIIVNAGVLLGANAAYDFGGSPFALDLAAGIYANLDLFRTIHVYADAKISLLRFTPGFAWLLSSKDENNDGIPDVSPEFSASLGLIYDITPLVSVNFDISFIQPTIAISLGAGLSF